MRALDTNVLIRYLVEDSKSPAQCRQAAALIDGCLERGEPLFVSDIVVVETARALKAVRPSAPSKAERALVLQECFESAGLVFSDLPLLQTALRAWEKGSGDFADYVIREQSLRAGATTTFSFDHALHGRSGFTPPTPGSCAKCKRRGAARE